MTEEHRSDNNEDEPACWFLILLVVVGLIVTLWATRDHILGFFAMSYALLTAGLAAIWICGPKLTDKTNIDPESLAGGQIRATVGILAMATLLGAVSLIAYGMTRPNAQGQRPDNTNNPSPTGELTVITGPVTSFVECPSPTVESVEITDPKPSPDEQAKSAPNTSN